MEEDIRKNVEIFSEEDILGHIEQDNLEDIEEDNK